MKQSLAKGGIKEAFQQQARVASKEPRSIVLDSSSDDDDIFELQPSASKKSRPSAAGLTVFICNEEDEGDDLSLQRRSHQKGPTPLRYSGRHLLQPIQNVTGISTSSPSKSMSVEKPKPIEKDKFLQLESSDDEEDSIFEVRHSPTPNKRGDSIKHPIQSSNRRESGANNREQAGFATKLDQNVLGSSSLLVRPLQFSSSSSSASSASPVAISATSAASSSVKKKPLGISSASKDESSNHHIGASGDLSLSDSRSHSNDRTDRSDTGDIPKRKTQTNKETNKEIDKDTGKNAGNDTVQQRDHLGKTVTYWICSICTYAENTLRRKKCEICMSSRGSTTQSLNTADGDDEEDGADDQDSDIFIDHNTSLADIETRKGQNTSSQAEVKAKVPAKAPPSTSSSYRNNEASSSSSSSSSNSSNRNVSTSNNSSSSVSKRHQQQIEGAYNGNHEEEDDDELMLRRSTSSSSSSRKKRRTVINDDDDDDDDGDNDDENDRDSAANCRNKGHLQQNSNIRSGSVANDDDSLEPNRKNSNAQSSRDRGIGGNSSGGERELNPRDIVEIDSDNDDDNDDNDDDGDSNNDEGDNDDENGNSKGSVRNHRQPLDAPDRDDHPNNDDTGDDTGGYYEYDDQYYDDGNGFGGDYYDQTGNEWEELPEDDVASPDMWRQSLCLYSSSSADLRSDRSRDSAGRSSAPRDREGRDNERERFSRDREGIVLSRAEEKRWSSSTSASAATTHSVATNNSSSSSSNSSSSSSGMHIAHVRAGATTADTELVDTDVDESDDDDDDVQIISGGTQGAKAGSSSSSSSSYRTQLTHSYNNNSNNNNSNSSSNNNSNNNSTSKKRNRDGSFGGDAFVELSDDGPEDDDDFDFDFEQHPPAFKPGQSSSSSSSKSSKKLKRNTNAVFYGDDENDYDDIDEFEDDQFHSHGHAPHQAPKPSFPDITEHFWIASSLKHSTHCAIDFDSFKLDNAKIDYATWYRNRLQKAIEKGDVSHNQGFEYEEGPDGEWIVWNEQSGTASGKTNGKGKSKGKASGGKRSKSGTSSSSSSNTTKKSTTKGTKAKYKSSSSGNWGRGSGSRGGEGRSSGWKGKSYWAASKSKTNGKGKGSYSSIKKEK